MLDNIKKALQSYYALPVILLVGIICWLCKSSAAVVTVWAIYVALVFLICDDVGNVFLPILFIPFFIDDILKNPHWVVYGIAIGVAVVSAGIFIVRNLIKNKTENHLKRGRLFYPLIVAGIAFMLGGVNVRFNVQVFFITFGFSAVILLLYWLSINFCKEFKKRLFMILLIGGVFISIEFFIANINNYGSLIDMIGQPSVWLGAQSINTTAIFYTLAMIGCFYLGCGKKYDWAFLILAFLFAVMTFLTYCRFMIFICSFVFLALTVYNIVKSPVKVVTILVFLLLMFACTLTVLYSEPIKKVIETFLKKFDGGLHGREKLWEWCVQKFKENPIFGYGYVSDEVLPSLRENMYLIHAHNTVLQWLVSTGIVGTLMLCWFYFEKYRTVIMGIRKKEVFLIAAILTIALSGMLDQAAAMDTFIYLVAILFISATEEITEPCGHPQFYLIKTIIKKRKVKKNEKNPTDDNAVGESTNNENGYSENASLSSDMQSK